MPVVIFTFGVPGRHIVQRLTQAGCVLLGSATSAKEAVALEESGVHAVICQGTEAGGHRTSAMLPESGDLGLMSLVPLVKAHTSLPVIAAGGIVNATQIRAAMAAGADGVSMGTIFLTSKECSTPQSHRDHIFNLDRDAKTVVTRIFTGRPARMLENRFYKEMSAIWQELPASERDLPWDFYCRDIFGTAARSNRPDLFILWGGQSVNLLAGKPTRPARDIIREIAADMGWSDNNLSTGAANHE